MLAGRLEPERSAPCPACIGLREMRQLVGVRFLEGGSRNETLDIGLGGGAIATGADLGDAQHSRHDQIGGGEPVFHQPFA